MEDRFNKEKSLELKGVAIIFMFWLHLYGHDNLIQNGNYYTELWGGVTQFLLTLSSICVPIFIFIAGYGFAIKQGSEKSLLKTIGGLYKKIWLVALFFFPLALFLGKLDFKITELGLNLSGFYFSYCGEWWFVSLYVLLEVYARVLEKTKVLNNLKLVALISGLLMIAGYGMKVLIPTAEKINTLEWIPYTFLIKKPIFISGYICKKLDVFNRPAVAKFGILGFIAWAFMFSNIPQSFFLPIVVPCFIAAFCCVPITGIMKKGLLLLGKNSTYMWLTHSWLIYKFLQPVIFSMHDVVANLIVLVITDLPVAFCDILLTKELYPVKIVFSELISACFKAPSSNSNLFPFPMVIPILASILLFLSVIPVIHEAFRNTSFVLDSPASLTTSL